MGIFKHDAACHRGRCNSYPVSHHNMAPIFLTKVSMKLKQYHYFQCWDNLEYIILIFNNTGIVNRIFFGKIHISFRRKGCDIQLVLLSNYLPRARNMPVKAFVIKVFTNNVFCKTSRVINEKKKTPWLWSASELCRPSDRRFLAK
jgi:hypothetical protein